MSPQEWRSLSPPSWVERPESATPALTRTARCSKPTFWLGCQSRTPVATNAIRGVPGGGFAWVIGSGEVELKASGKIEVEVRGLVLAATGRNPAKTFRVRVSCLSVDATGAPTTMNVHDGPVPC